MTKGEAQMKKMTLVVLMLFIVSTIAQTEPTPTIEVAELPSQEALAAEVATTTEDVAPVEEPVEAPTETVETGAPAETAVALEVVATSPVVATDTIVTTEAVAPVATTAAVARPSQEAVPTEEAAPVEEVAKAEAPQEEPKEEAKKKEKKEEKAQKAKKSGNPDIQKHFGLGIQIMSTGYTRTTNMTYELGLIFKQKHYHGISLYHKIYEWDYNVGTVWGINYDYKRRFGTKFIRLDVGLLAGWNLYEENATADNDAFRHVRIGGPQADLNLYFGPVQIFGGYTYLMGFREYGDVRKYDGTHQISLGFGIRMGK